ncbi:hypothetical protein BKH43_05840 [Helicobacter sp. 13S00401-1]|uniref:LapA family protein n=1 Tax=Helicobacter sp. 13S00401-1 TaxID=1905758 RepID=UPI000BA6016C|nr:LapA family protein [Helicobacter sp. 13S00401-1]PAF50130.1 hypothetical protein BKH43_05840 [Helicobacter sp. 13S00401-1]
MKLRYFIIIGIIYIVCICGFLFYTQHVDYTITSIAGKAVHISMPIALWIAIILVVLFIIALIFMTSNKIAQTLKRLRYKREYAKLLAQINTQSLGGHTKTLSFSTDEFKSLSLILARFSFKPLLNSQASGNAHIDALFDSLHSLQTEGSLKDTKLNLDVHNVFYEKYLIASLKNGSKKPLDVLNMSYPDVDLSKAYLQAWEEMIKDSKKESKDITKTLSQSTPKMDYEIAKMLFTKSIEGSLELSHDSMLKILSLYNFNAKEFFNLVDSLLSSLTPGNINFYLSIFEEALKKNENMTIGYIYLLLEIGKSSEAKDFISHYPKGHFPIFEAYLELKDKRYNLKSFFEPFSTHNVNIPNEPPVITATIVPTLELPLKDV